MAQTIGRYEIIRELGRGGMATVYLALDPRIQRQVAIKVLPRQFTHDPKFLARFEQEAQTIAALEDPAIVPVYDFGEDGDAPYIVMRYMTDGTLRARIGTKPVPLTKIVRILERLAPALDMAHQQGVIHRDIKPDNVLFDNVQRPYLADFGIARMAEATHTMTIVGTPSYMSPEQVRGEQELDWRSDLYALGVILFELLTGRQPYEAKTPSGLMFKHAMEPVPDLLAINPELPSQAQKVIEKAMAKEREERYQSAWEMVTAVRGLIAVDDAHSSWRVATGATIVEDLEKTNVLDQKEEVSDASPSTSSGNDSADREVSSALRQAQQPGREVEEFAVAEAPETTKDFDWHEEEANSVPVAVGATVVEEAEITKILDSQEEELISEPKVAVSAVVEDARMTEVLDPQVAGGLPALKTELDTPPGLPSASLPPADPGLDSKWLRPQDKMTMVYVPAGSFSMGSKEGSSDEEPLHKVTLGGFWIDQTEVTNSQYAEFLNEMGNQEEGDLIWIRLGDRFKEKDGKFVARPVFADHPVINVSWYGAAAYCDWVGGHLPTEAQWEYAARGPESKRYPWGNESPTCDLAQFDGCDGNTVTVGSYADGASWVGALDMVGNVWEWVNDWYDGSYYAKSLQNNPQGPVEGGSKVLRGGSWHSKLVNLRCANRSHDGPDHRSVSIGFRCSLPGK